jgi:AcrR family transcriptional regulator
VNSSSPQKRSGRYRSDRRRQQAEETRRAILDAAARLFVERGYAGTSLEAIARAAGVAVQTVYASVGGKQILLRAINDRIDEEAGLAPAVEEMTAAGDPQQLLRLTMQLTRQFAERKGDFFAALVAAAAGEPELGAIVAEGRRRHREGTQWVVGLLAAMGALRPDVSTERAAQILGLLTWPDSWAMLVREYALSYDQAEDWLTSVVGDSILAERPR